MPHITENEMTTKHSPGPWTFQERGCLILDARTGSSQCAVAHVQVNTYKDEGMHNARLIAAAPELLTALESAREFIVDGLAMGFVGMPEDEDVLEVIEKANSKAKGEVKE